MLNPLPSFLEPELFQDFIDSLTDIAPNIERDINVLKLDPKNIAIIADLFRSVHNLKGDAALCKFELGAHIAHPIESILSQLRDDKIIFSDILAEAILLAIDRLELAVGALASGKSLEHLQLRLLIAELHKLAEKDAHTMDSAAADMIEHITGFRPGGKNIHPVYTAPTEHSPEKVKHELSVFRTFALALEKRSPLFQGRIDRLLHLAAETNSVMGLPIDPVQLEAAVYVHDLGMMFLPESVWLKIGNLTPEERELMHTHPHYATQLLSCIEGWEPAMQMVQQHHEMSDGTGYPAGLKEQAICEGAKILAIIDAFEAVTLKHQNRGQTRSVLRAIAEINASQNQFAQPWINGFNQVVRKMLEA